ncbi:MAG TPA: hypothetical protein VFC56_19890 [Stellaceae bacterium]|nr:hypothetical protein [Stellaceae bacterium]
MRWSIAPMLALSLVCWSVGSEACDCLDHPHPIKHRAWIRHVFREHSVVHAYHAYADCPIALAQEIRPGCNSYSRLIIGFR